MLSRKPRAPSCPGFYKAARVSSQLTTWRNGHHTKYMCFMYLFISCLSAQQSGPVPICLVMGSLTAVSLAEPYQAWLPHQLQWRLPSGCQE